MKAVILAGGFGKRLRAKYENIPKPLVEVDGKPVILREIEVLSREGINEFIVVTCYLHEKIEEYLGDGRSFGVKIEYYNEKTPMGSAGALFKLHLEEPFLLVNGDIVFDFSLKRMLAFHNGHNALLTAFAHPNSHPYDSTLLACDNNGAITDIFFENKPEYYMNLCNAGIQILSDEVFRYLPEKDYADFDRDVLAPVIKTGRAFAYRSTEYAADMGTLDRLEKVEADVRTGLVCRKNLLRRQRAVFLDRDGTVNRYKGYITRPQEIELLPSVAEAISAFHKIGYLVIIITNQPVIARGDCTFETLEKIHRKLSMLLGEQGAYIDDLFFCPHHPEGGFEGERKEYKRKCSCRKPSAGMILEAAEKYNIDLSLSYMVGDSLRDIETARNAGCTPIYLKSGENGEPGSDVLSFDRLSDFSIHLWKEREKTALS